MADYTKYDLIHEEEGKIGELYLTDGGFEYKIFGRTDACRRLKRFLDQVKKDGGVFELTGGGKTEDEYWDAGQIFPVKRGANLTPLHWNLAYLGVSLEEVKNEV
ncbi:hypothetical protein H5T87_07680 [bacterium]|nr:hypothetical protein [bacterium]